MSKETLKSPALVLKGRGMDDSNPTSPFQTWFRTGGLFGDMGVLSRLPGKRLTRKYDAPVLAIHSDMQGNFWVQTSAELRVYTASAFNDSAVA